MNRRPAIAWLVVTSLALAADAAAAHAVAGRDVLAALFAGFEPRLLALLIVLAGARLYLLALAPGWLLFIGADAVIEGVRRRRAVPRRTGITR